MKIRLIWYLSYTVVNHNWLVQINPFVLTTFCLLGQCFLICCVTADLGYLIGDVLSHRAGVCWGHGDKCPDSSSVVLFSGRTATNCSVNNGDCDHECHKSDDGLGRTCSCIKGYQLQDNSKKCTAKSKLPQQNAQI